MQSLALVTSAERVAVPPVLGRAAGLTAKEETVVVLALAGRVDAPLTPASRTMNTLRTETATRAADRPRRLAYSISRRSFQFPRRSFYFPADHFPPAHPSDPRPQPSPAPGRQSAPSQPTPRYDVVGLQRRPIAGPSRQQGPKPLPSAPLVDEPCTAPLGRLSPSPPARNHPSGPPPGLRIHDAEVDPCSASPRLIYVSGAAQRICGPVGLVRRSRWASPFSIAVLGRSSGQPTDGVGRRVGRQPQALDNPGWHGVDSLSRWSMVLGRP